MSAIRKKKNGGIVVTAGDVYSIWKQEEFASYEEFAAKYSGKKFHKWDKYFVPTEAPISGAIPTI